MRSRSRYQGFISGVIKHANHGSKDELEMATSWNRAFADILVALRWLDGFCSINAISAKRIMGKFVDLAKKLGGDEYESYLYNLTMSKDFTHPVLLSDIKNELLEYFASVFTKGNIRAARKMLDKAHPTTRTRDIQISSFNLGVTAATMFLTIIMIMIPGAGAYQTSWVLNVLPTYRYFLLCDFALFGVSIAIRFFRLYAVNYISIFQLDPSYRMREAQVNRVAMLVLNIINISFIIQLITFKLDFIPDHSSLFTLIMTVVIFAILLAPCHCIYRTARMELMRVIGCILISPFSSVTFKEFFLADVITSMVSPLQDLSITVCYFCTDAWLYDKNAYCTWLAPVAAIIGLLPYYWRFLQCLRKYRDTREKHPHLVNAGKYMSKILVAIVSIVQVFSKQKYPTLTLILTIIATLYCLIWDMTMDWGLLRESPVYPMLRSKLLYPASYYYFAMITNLILRFAWVITLFKGTIFYTSPIGTQGLLFMLGIAELYRRIQWSLFRVENENVNNFENYRTVLEIPELPEEEQAYY